MKRKKKQDKHKLKRGRLNAVKALQNTASKSRLPGSILDQIVMEPRLKILYFIPHSPQSPDDTSFLGMYSPGICSTSSIMSYVSSLPGDIREPYSKRYNLLHFRLRRLLWRNVIPIDVRFLQQALESFPTPFRVILTNAPDVAQAVDRLIQVAPTPILHVSSVLGQGRLLASKFDLDKLLAYADTVLERLAKDQKANDFVKTVRALMSPDDKQAQLLLDIPKSFHNVTKPNEIALKSYGYGFEKEDPIVPDRNPAIFKDPSRYIERICEIADAVYTARQKLMEKLPLELLDYSYLLTVPSVEWSSYHSWRARSNNFDLSSADRKAFRIVYRAAVKQETYFDTIENNDQSYQSNRVFRSFMALRSVEQSAYTAGLTLLATATLTPVLRFEPKLNKVREHLKMLAHCVRSESRIRAQYKQSRLARVVGERMRSLVDQRFLDRIDQLNDETQIRALKLVAELPLELMPCHGIPLGMRYDVSRTPLLPGNLFIAQCTLPPVFVTVPELFDILVIRSFKPDDHLKPLLQMAIDSIKHSSEWKGSIRFVDVSTEEEFIAALNAYSGPILIFDGHGSYEGEYGVGSIVIGDKPINVWRLREQCQMPPIVIFSACDTHPMDGSHGSTANAAFALGARTVLATSLPVNGMLSAAFIGRLILRIFEFVPVAIKIRKILTWREVISGMLRMTFVSEITRLLVKHAKIRLTQVGHDKVQLAANIAINNRETAWYETYLSALSKETGESVDTLLRLVTQWASLTDALKYIQLGSPENIILTTGE